MLYTEKEKHEIERVKEVFAEHLRQSPDFELLWSDKVGYVWLAIGVNPVYVDTALWGILIWKEFKGAPAISNRLNVGMFILFVIGLGFLIYAGA